MKIIDLKSGKNIKDFNNYYEKNKNNDKIKIVAFLAKWCGFCEKFKPEWENFKIMANKEMKDGLITTASDENMEKLSCDKNIDGFPTIRIFQNGKHHDYSGERNSNSLLNYIKKIKSVENNNTDMDKSSITTLKDKNELFLKGIDKKKTDARKNISNHIISKLKELSNKAKKRISNKNNKKKNNKDENKLKKTIKKLRTALKKEKEFTKKIKEVTKKKRGKKKKRGGG